MQSKKNTNHPSRPQTVTDPQKKGQYMEASLISDANTKSFLVNNFLKQINIAPFFHFRALYVMPPKGTFITDKVLAWQGMENQSNNNNTIKIQQSRSIHISPFLKSH